MKNKLYLSILLCILISFSIFSVMSVSAQNGSCGDNIIWNLTDGTLTLIGYGDMPSTNFYSIADTTKKIVISEGITSISRGAFSNFKNLVDISLPSSLKVISGDAFWACSSLTRIDIPENVCQIDPSSFVKCTSITSVNVSSANNYFSSADDVLFNKEQTKLIYYPEGKTNSEYTVPTTVTELGSFAFRGCAYLNCIYAGEHITTINDYAFYEGDFIVHCQNNSAVSQYVQNYKWGNYDYLFYRIDNEAVLISSGTCGENLTYSHYSDGTMNIEGTGSFITGFENNTTNHYIHTKILKIGAEVQGINSNDGSAFRFDNSMVEIIVDKNNPYLTTVDGVLFNKDISVLIKYPTGHPRTSYRVPDGVKRIRERAFERSRYLNELILPQGLLSIDYGSLYSGSLQTVNLPSSIEHIGAWSMIYSVINTDISTLTSLCYLGSNAFITTDFYNNWLEKQPDGVVYLGNVLLCYKGDMPENTFISVKEGTTQIFTEAFAGCTNLVDIKIPDSVCSIGTDAFRDTTWFNVQPEGMVYAGKVAYQFKGTTSESEIIIQEGTLGIGGSAFAPNYNLENPYFESITKIILPDSIVCIDNNAFSACTQLKSIKLPEKIALIDRYWGTFENVEEVTGYPGTFSEQFAFENGLKFNKVLFWKIPSFQITDNKFTYTLQFSKGYENNSAVVLTSLLNRSIPVTIDVQSITPLSGETSISVDILKNSYNFYKTFIWENLSNIKPIQNYN